MARPTWWVLVLVIGGLVTTGASADQKEASKEDYYELHKLLVDTLDQVERNYVKDISRRELIEAAIRGVIRELDPYSSYISPKEIDQFRSSVEAEFGGIGIQVSTERGPLEVISPLVGTPAFRAGVLAGDRIMEINGESTKGISIQQAVKRLKGKAGTEVTITVLHRGRSKAEKIKITREVIHVETVLGDRRDENDHWNFLLDDSNHIGYVRISAFSRDTARELREALDSLTAQQLQGLILDLRFNPGGLLNSAIEVSDMFVSEGRIVSVKGREAEDTETASEPEESGEAKTEQTDDSQQRTWEAKKEGTYGGFPMVVLVNRYSASASEIVSGCLQDHQRAVVIGERTWGKGSVQNVIPLEDGRSALKLTTASYHRPGGRNIHRFPNAGEDDEWGVMPDDGYKLQLTDDEMLALINYRRQRDVILPDESEKTEPAQSETPSDTTAEETAEEAAEEAVEEASEETPDAGEDAPKVDDADDHAEDQPETGDDAESDPETGDTTSESETKELEESEFVDLHLRMAVDYLVAELASAG